jgi:protein O-mannosyl-transferase
MSKPKKSLNKRDSQPRPKITAEQVHRFGMLAGGATLIALAIFIAYLPSINGGFVLDDDEFLTQNPLIQTFDGLYRFWCSTKAQEFYPVSYSSLWIEWRLWERNPAGYHVTNLILHFIDVLLIWIILRKMRIPGAFFAAMIFAVHPVNVESAAWIAQLRNMLAMTFFLLSILWYFKAGTYAASTDIAPTRSHGGPWERETIFSSFILHPSSFHFWYRLSLAAYVLAMLSKGSAAVLPVLLLGIVWWLRPLTKWDLARAAPFFLIAVALTGVNVWFQTHGEEVVIRSTDFTHRLLGAGGVVWFYLYKALLPVELVFIYPQWHIEAGNVLWWLPLLAVLIVTMLLWSYRKSWSRPLYFTWGFFCVALLPVLGFIDVGFMKYSLVADHYQHIAIIGVIALAAAGFNFWHQRMRGLSHRVAAIAAVAAVGILVFLTWHQSGLYSDQITLYQATLEKNPNCWIAHNNLGKRYYETGRLQDAIEHYRRAVVLNPLYVEAHYNLGLAINDSGNPKESIEHYQRALQLGTNHPEVYNNMGNALLQTGHPLESIRYYEQAIRLDPDFVSVHNNLGAALIQAGRPQDATEHFKHALHQSPGYTDALSNLALAYADMNRSSDAIETAKKAMELARSQGQTAQAKQIADWLNAYRDKLSGLPDTPPAGEHNSPPP